MCPESSNISEIRLYKSVSFPFKWKFYKTIIKNINAVDNIIFKKNNLWWLFTNVDYSNCNDFSHDLSIFYSKKGPLTDKWKCHPQNPKKINSLESRNAGIIFNKNKVIRISQEQGFDNYGQNIITIEIINKQNFNTLNYKVVSNVTAKAYENINEIKKLLIKQIESPVRWRESIEYMISQGSSSFIEIGPGKVLSGLIKRIDKTAQVVSINNEQEIKDIKI